MGLGFRPPLDWEGLLRFLGPRAIPGVEEVRDGTYRRGCVVGGSAAVLEVAAGPGATLDVRPPARAVEPGLRRLFDLDGDPALVAEVLSADPVLRPLVAARPGLRAPGSFDGFELAVRAILGQQISVAGATTLAGRLVRNHGRPLAHPDGGLTHAFPTPEALAEASLDGVGMPGRRAATLRALGRAVAEGVVVLDGSADPAATRESLLELPGIGPWTASYVAMRALGDRDAFPAADLGVLRAAAALGLSDDPARLTAHAERWRPYRSYAVHHLWASLGSPAGG
jgi:AraC family transcriptional regulator, regulatory protein of adaptative response / DNA-3-methyladenine glycosylase II